MSKEFDEGYTDYKNTTHYYGANFPIPYKEGSIERKEWFKGRHQAEKEEDYDVSGA